MDKTDIKLRLSKKEADCLLAFLEGLGVHSVDDAVKQSFQLDQSEENDDQIDFRVTQARELKHHLEIVKGKLKKVFLEHICLDGYMKYIL